MYLPITKPRKHQVDALDAMSGRAAFALLMEMGTGKSKVILDEFGQLEANGEVNDLLVLAPAGAYCNWSRIDDEDPGEIQKHVSAELRSRLLVFTWKSGSSCKKKVLPFLQASGPRVLVMNTEALSSPATTAEEVCTKFLENGRGIMVVDESTSIKNYKARRTKAVLRLRHMAKVRRIATGMVAPRSPLDIYTQYEFLDPTILGFKSFWSFRSRYAVTKKVLFGGRKVDLVIGYRNIDELQRKIADHSFRVLKDDCLDIPPKVYESRDVPMTPEQLQMYHDIKKYATAALGGEKHVTATAVITQILRLHQILCGHVVDEEGNVHDVKERRTDELVSLLEEHNGKAIIWTAYAYSLKTIASRLRKEFGQESVALFWGGNRGDRSEEEARWKSDERCRFMIATPGAGGKGNTWTAANLVVYYSNTYDLEARAQSEDRAHRDGQSRSVTYVDLVARGTVDEKIISALRRKIDIASTISGDNYREWII